MKKIILLALLLAGCSGANTRYHVECANSPQIYNYHGWKTCPNVCPDEGTIVAVKTRWGVKTYRVSNCPDLRVTKWKRIRGR